MFLILFLLNIQVHAASSCSLQAPSQKLDSILKQVAVACAAEGCEVLEDYKPKPRTETDPPDVVTTGGRIMLGAIKLWNFFDNVQKKLDQENEKPQGCSGNCRRVNAPEFFMKVVPAAVDSSDQYKELCKERDIILTEDEKKLFNLVPGRGHYGENSIDVKVECPRNDCPMAMRDWFAKMVDSPKFKEISLQKCPLPCSKHMLGKLTLQSSGNFMSVLIKCSTPKINEDAMLVGNVINNFRCEKNQ